MALHVLSYFPTTITIDGEIVQIHITRLDPEEWLAFDHERTRTGQPTAPAPEGETPEQQTVRERQEWDLAQAACAHMRLSIASYITVEPGHIVEGDDEQPVTEGAALVRLYGGRVPILAELMFRIWSENGMSAAAKAEMNARLFGAPEGVAA